MDSGDLKPWQFDKLATSITPTRDYLDRLEQRMRDRGFPINNPLARAVSFALASLQSLENELERQRRRRIK